jgi:dihydropteroate synthase
MTPAGNRTYASPVTAIGGRSFTWGTRTYVMGVLNITPDSFSGDGLAGQPEAAAAVARRFEAEGADILDIGAESSRPGAAELPADEEARRLLPALEAVRKATRLPISVDTYHSSVAAAASEAGADAINDIHGLRRDPGMAGVVAAAGVPLIAMHNERDRPFHDVIADTTDGFNATLEIARAAGIGQRQIILDPGFGFGWTPEQNLEMVRRLPELWGLGFPLLLGVSRKSTIGYILGAPVHERMEGTAALVALAVAGGADIVRVHDVAAMVKVVRVADATVRGNWRYEPGRDAR